MITLTLYLCYYLSIRHDKPLHSAIGPAFDLLKRTVVFCLNKLFPRQMKISLIAAMDNNRVIGVHNTLPWHLPADLKHFKALTMGKPILMGRKTYESIGRPLPGRDNIILSRQAGFSAEGCTVMCSVEKALAYADTLEAEELMVIGGAQLYEAMLPMAARLYLTRVDTEVEGGDAFFPEINRSEWTKLSWETHAADDKNAHPYAFTILQRVGCS